MRLRSVIRKVLKEEMKLPTFIRRRTRYNEEDIINFLKRYSLRFLTKRTYNSPESVLKDACSETAYEIVDSTHTFIDEDSFDQYQDEIYIFLMKKYGDQLKDFIEDFYSESGDEFGYDYVFRKHSERNGGKGFSDSFPSWNDLLMVYSSWFPDLDWKEIKRKLDDMEGNQLLIKSPKEKNNDTNHYFSVYKVKTLK